MTLRFWMSARKAENGFLDGRIVSSGPARRNIRGKIVNIFNVRKMPGFQMGKVPASRTDFWALPSQLWRSLGCTAAKSPPPGEDPSSGLLAGGREQIAAAPDGPDHGRLGRVRLDLAANPHDAQVHGAVEGLAVAG